MLAIQGHSKRGKEVIQILESLGGINRVNQKGRYPNYFYYVSGDDNTIAWTAVRPKHLDVFTLEEFEKEFPFKVGDKVIYSYTPNFVGTVVDIKFDDNIPYRVDIEGTICTCGTNMLKSYKEMKEERNITLTLDKAKEWYKKGGELKEIALQAFTEHELNPLPRSWEEFCKKYPVKDKEAHFDSLSSIVVHKDISQLRSIGRDRNICPSQKSAEAHLAMIQLEQLRNCWWNGWEPIWDISQKYCIYLSHNEVQVRMCTNVARFLTFPTREMAIEFLECFRDLIELARNLI